MNNRILIFFFVIILLFGGLILLMNPREFYQEDEKLSIVASFYPLGFFAEEIGGDLVNVDLLIPPGVAPHDFEPTPQDLLDAKSANVFIYHGADFDPWAKNIVDNVLDSDVKVLEITNNILLETFSSEEGLDPHIWLDPIKAKEMVAVVGDFLKPLFKGDQLDELNSNIISLIDSLDSLDTNYSEGLANCNLNDFVVAHDAFSYLANRYHLNAISISGLSPQDQPSAKKLGEMVALVKEKGIKHILFESLASPQLAQTLANEADASTLTLNPLEGLTQEEQDDGDDYFLVMEDNLVNLKTALDCEGKVNY